MLTKTQRDWATAQVGKDRVTAVEGEITAATATEDDDSYILEVSGPHGRVELPVTAEANVLAAMQDSGMTVRLEGKVTGVQLDEENGRVGLEIAGESGSTVEWVVPEMSEADRAAQAEQAQAKAEAEETAKKNEEVLMSEAQRQFQINLVHQQIREILVNDELVRESIREILDPPGDV